MGLQFLRKGWGLESQPIQNPEVDPTRSMLEVETLNLLDLMRKKVYCDPETKILTDEKGEEKHGAVKGNVPKEYLEDIAIIEEIYLKRAQDKYLQLMFKDNELQKGKEELEEMKVLVAQLKTEIQRKEIHRNKGYNQEENRAEVLRSQVEKRDKTIHFIQEQLKEKQEEIVYLEKRVATEEDLARKCTEEREKTVNHS